MIVTIEGFEEASDLTVNSNEVLLRCMIVNLMEKRLQVLWRPPGHW
ncbi:MAG: hypothetical protein IPH60_00005 [Flavobacteriales bacterium]|nr:hypothetical protein [Flavobacteriales bacterium]